MATVMNVTEFVEKLKYVAENHKTLYVMGCFGAPMTNSNKLRYIVHHSYNQRERRREMIYAASTDTFGFDCVCLIKGILWGWSGDVKKGYGGAAYASNNVPDISANSMIKECSDISTDFSNIEIGELVWTTGHVGVYIGDGLAVECTPTWKNGVQITACNCKKPGYNTRNWKKHGKLPYVDYATIPENDELADILDENPLDEIAKEVIAGKWYTGAARRSALTKAGYNYAEVQARVNELVNANKKSVDEIADEVIDGKWGVGSDRRKRLTKAGYNYAEVQKRVNELCKR